jgi:hypothetical protein
VLEWRAHTRVRWTLPDLAHQTLTAPALHPDAMCALHELNVTHVTAEAWPETGQLSASCALRSDGSPSRHWEQVKPHYNYIYPAPMARSVSLLTGNASFD